MTSVPVSVLDRSRTRAGESPGTALRNTLERAERAGRTGDMLTLANARLVTRP